MKKNNNSLSNSIVPPTLLNSRRIIRSLKAKADAKRTFYQKAADWTTETFGSVSFLTLNIVWFAVWIFFNSGLIPEFHTFDPYPYGLLTMIVSLEAIILSIFVLISQNRASQIDDLREEIDLQVDIITEQEITKLMEMVNKLLIKNRIDTSADQVLQSMLKPTNIETIEKSLEKQITDHNTIFR